MTCFQTKKSKAHFCVIKTPFVYSRPKARFIAALSSPLVLDSGVNDKVSCFPQERNNKVITFQTPLRKFDLLDLVIF